MFDDRFTPSGEPVSPAFPYGREHPDGDAWLCDCGRIHTGLGPHLDLTADAVAYAEAGALVLPLHSPDGNMPGGCTCRSRTCGSVGKHPRTLNGLADATSDVDTVRRWWGMWPAANIGLRPQSGHVVVDIDPRHGGHLQVVAMQEHHGPLTPTRTAATGGGGWHLWYGFHGPHVAALAPGIDVKGHGGYVVAPPSVHASGARYEWRNTGPIAPAPTYLASLILRLPVQRRAADGHLTDGGMQGLVAFVKAAQPGERNRRLYWACCRAHEGGADVAALVDAAVGTGLDPHEAMRTAASAANTTRVGAAR